jgi:hypothetical protein
MKINYEKWFNILQLSPDATLDEIHNAYKRLINLVHPDLHPENSNRQQDAEQMSKELNEAYDELKKLYDNGYKPQRTPEDVDMPDEDPEITELSDEQYLIYRSNGFEPVMSVVTELDNKFSKVEWDNIPTISIRDAKDGMHSGRPISLLAYIYSQTNPIPINRDEKNRMIELSSVSISLKDSSQREISCLPIVQSNFISKYGDILESKGLLRFSGFIMGIEEREYFFYLKKIESNLSALDLIGLKPDRKDDITEKFLKTVKHPKGVRGFIKEQIVEHLSISGLDKAKELNKALDFIILQSFSFGMASKGNYCNKLHSLVIGSPAVGKKLLTKTAMILNPVAYEIPSTSAKVTSAGLVGNAQFKSGKMTSNPGYLPLANGGIICIQDFHEIVRGGKSSHGLMSLLSKFMEDGEVIDATSARTTHRSATAIHMDMNRLSQVIPDKEFVGHKDIGIRSNILSRCDFIIEIPRNEEIQMHVASNMVKSWEDFSSQLIDDQKTPDWLRDLKVIVAYFTTNFRTVDLAPEIIEYIQAKLEELKTEYGLKMTGDYKLSDMTTRIANSIAKFLKSIACANHSFSIKKENVDEAFSYIKCKMDFLSSFQPEPKTSKISPVKDRAEFIMEKFSGQKISISEVIDYVNSIPKSKVSNDRIRKTVYAMAKNGTAQRVRGEKGIYVFNKNNEN